MSALTSRIFLVFLYLSPFRVLVADQLARSERDRRSAASVAPARGRLIGPLMGALAAVALLAAAAVPALV